MKLVIIILFGLVFTSFGCKKFIEVDSPTTNINGQNVFESEPTAIAVINGIYSSMAANFRSNDLTTISIVAGLAADEF
jgi:starch-binding outer membrane protein, SusD/RagB family